jgi:hypothetical protein
MPKLSGRAQKLPYNAQLKTLCWKIGQSFCKVSGKQDAVYGQLYVQFKTDEVSRNENGQYAPVDGTEQRSSGCRISLALGFDLAVSQ